MNFAGTWDIVSSPDFDDEYMSEGSIFHIRSEFFRNLRSLSEQWH